MTQPTESKTGSNMKTTVEILKEMGIDDKLEIDTSKPFPEGLRYLTSEAMQAYADQQVKAERNKVIDECKIEMQKIIPQFWNATHWNLIKEKLESLKIKQP